MTSRPNKRPNDTEDVDNSFGPIARFCAFSAGARIDILTVCPTDRAAYLGLGGTVVATSVMAFISMVFALNTAFHASLSTAVIGGTVWAVIIYNLDRWLVSSQKRLGSAWRQILQTLPRLALAVVIGFVISEPLVIELFRPEIEQKIESDAVVERDGGRNSKRSKGIETKIEEVKTRQQASSTQVADKYARIDVYKSEIEEAERELDDLRDRLNAERFGIPIPGQTTGKYGCGGECRRLERAIAVSEVRLSEVEQRNNPLIKDLNVDIGKLEDEAKADRRQSKAEDNETIALLKIEKSKIDSKISADFDDAVADAGVLRRIEALDDLGNERSAVNLTHLLLVALLIALDTLPVLGKLLQSLGPKRPYELVADAMDRKVAEEAAAIEEEAVAERRFRMELRTSDRGARSEAEQQNIRHFIERAAQTQREVGDVILDAWRDGELNRTRSEVDQHGGGERRRSTRRRIEFGPKREHGERRHLLDRRNTR